MPQSRQPVTEALPNHHVGLPVEQTFTEPVELAAFTDCAMGEQLLETYLRPYMDNDILDRRLLAQSRVFRKFPEAKGLVSEALAADDDDSIFIAAELLDDARKQSKPDKETPVGAMLSLLSLANSIVTINLDTLGSHAPSGRANAIAQNLERKFVTDIPEGKLEEYLFTANFLHVRMDAISRIPGGTQYTGTFMRGKLLLLTSDLRARCINKQYAESMPGADEQPPTAEQIAADTAEVSNIFTQLRANQQYGIKLGFRPYEYGGSLIFSQTMGVEAMQKFASHPNVDPTELRSVKAVASVVHSARRSFKHLKPERYDTTDLIEGYNLDKLDPVTYYHIGPDGELYVDRQCNQPLRDAFINQGKYKAYRKLQADILASYFDMTQPAEVVNKAGKQAAARLAEASGEDRSEPMDIFRRLVIPRLRYIQNEPESVAEAMQSESREEAQSTSKALRYHGVVMHRRRLPDGWSASPEAKEFAEALGIVLRENETLVREHHRGSKTIGEVVAHELVER